MNTKIIAEINGLSVQSISPERKALLSQIAETISTQLKSTGVVNLNFICTHNSRRSHLGQVWGQTMAAYYTIKGIKCFSGGTEATAVYPMVLKTLKSQGFVIDQDQDNTENPHYKISYTESEPSILAFSKCYDDTFNPATNFMALLTCGQADEECPFIPGASHRFPLTYLDPKAFDNTDLQAEKYHERSVQIATEMKFLFSSIS